MSKRRRTASGFTAKRPIDKSLIFVENDALTVTQTALTLLTPSAPCTMVGLRWDLSVFKSQRVAGTAANFTWAIVLVQDGNTANQMTVTDGQSFYEPEQNVLAFGVSPVLLEQMQAQHISGNTKTMRKLRIGDTIQFLTKGQNTNSPGYRGIIQLFCKS